MARGRVRGSAGYQSVHQCVCAPVFVSTQAHVEIAGAAGVRARADPGFHEVLRVLHLDPEIKVGRKMGVGTPLCGTTRNTGNLQYRLCLSALFLRPRLYLWVDTFIRWYLCHVELG